MILKKLKIAVSFFCFIFNSAYGCEVKISWEPWRPYQYKEGENLTGLDIELAEALVKVTGCKASFIELPWNRQLASVELGEVDMVLGAGKTAEREKWADFTSGYRKEINSLFMKPGLGAEIKKIADLKTTPLKIGITRGAYYSHELEAIRSLFDDSADVDAVNVKKMAAGRLDGLIMDHFTGLSLMNEQKSGVQMVLHPLSISSGDVYFLVSKKTKIMNLVSKLNEAIKKMKASGGHAKIIARYSLNKKTQ